MLTPHLPYSSASEYEGLLPRYTFGGQSDVLVALEAIRRQAGSKSITMADCGAGSGRIWQFLPENISTIVAVDPNVSIQRSVKPSRVRCVPADGLTYLRDHGREIDLVSWLWSMNYAILQYFETYDPSAKAVVIKDWEEGDKRARRALREALGGCRDASFVFMFFDSDSEEQRFVTDLWSQVAPFPFHDRSHTRMLLIDELNKFCSLDSSRALRVEHLTGEADYGPLSEAEERMLQFHLRGHFNGDPSTRAYVRTFLTKYEIGGRVLCPAGVYLIEVAKC